MTAMDNGPLWSQDPYGNYWLLFPNKHALTKDEIRDLFSHFGNVKLITESGDERGLRFVQYSCLDEVKNAVENLRDHPAVKLVPYRPKNAKNVHNNVTKEENIDIDPERRNFFQRKPASNFTHRNSNNHKSSSDSNTVDYQSIEYESNYERFSSCSSNASNHQMNDDGFSISNNYVEKSHVERITSPVHFPKSAVDPMAKVKMLLETRGITSNTFNTGTAADSGNVDYADELPDLVPSNKIKPQALSRKVIYNADEVIVANIPNEYGSAYILHLFEELEPLAITHIKIARKHEIRYCHVYFKSAEDSIAAETMFDKFDLCGKKLVVLRPCNLQEEVASFRIL